MNTRHRRKTHTHTQINFFENFLVAESFDHGWLQQAANGRKSYVDQKIKEWVLIDRHKNFKEEVQCKFHTL
jgi:hypothetical protein